MGDILLAVNPFKSLPIYAPEVQRTYNRAGKDALAPHIYYKAFEA